MAFFPLINGIFLIILFRIHRRIFYITAFLEIALYIFGSYFISQEYSRAGNVFLAWFGLFGAGLIMALIAFIIAISLNHRHLYDDQKSVK